MHWVNCLDGVCSGIIGTVLGIQSEEMRLRFKAGHDPGYSCLGTQPLQFVYNWAETIAFFVRIV